MHDAHRPISVAIVAFPETTASVVYGLFDLFASAGRDWGVIVDGNPGAQLFEPIIVAKTPGPIVAGNGVTITAERALEDCLHPAIACVPEVSLAPGEQFSGRFDQEIGWATRCFANGATLATSCSGAMLLAEARMLDGLEATTHWAWCDEMRRRYPAVKVHERRALVITGEGQRLVMAGGGTSWLDLALYLIGRFTSIETAMQVARINLIDWHAVGQQPFARLARSRQVDDAVIARCQEWIAHHYREPAPVAAMVRLSGLAERTFNRRFQAATAMSPLDYVHTLRLEEAKQMLESGDEPVEVVANEVGYEDAGFFSRLFVRKVSLTPTQYRRRFGAMRKAMEAANGDRSAKL
jgi:transcriptional regulator GlxA family with amidase domain